MRSSIERMRLWMLTITLIHQTRYKNNKIFYFHKLTWYLATVFAIHEHIWQLAHFIHPGNGGLYLAPHIPGGLRWSPGDFPESTWSPGAFFLAGSPAKLACIIHLDFTRTPGGFQMNHMESVESTCQIAVWILPGLNPWSIHQESRWSLSNSEFILLYF